MTPNGLPPNVYLSNTTQEPFALSLIHIHLCLLTCIIAYWSIWQENSASIVMVTNLVEVGRVSPSRGYLDGVCWLAFRCPASLCAKCLPFHISPSRHPTREKSSLLFIVEEHLFPSKPSRPFLHPHCPLMMSSHRLWGNYSHQTWMFIFTPQSCILLASATIFSFFSSIIRLNHKTWLFLLTPNGRISSVSYGAG